MAAYLLVGLPGTGKTTTLRELAELGYKTIDADNDEQLSIWRHKATGETTRNRLRNDTTWNEDYSWSWDGTRLQELLSDAGEQTLIIGGNASNVSEFYAFFDKVFALILDDSSLQARIADRGKGYGMAPDELQSILGWNKDFAEVEVQRGASVVDARPSPASIAAVIAEGINDRR